MERNRERWVRYLASIAVVAGLSPAAWAAPIAMPVGSTVWMKAEASTCPFADGGDCAGSNLLGPAPPNGIPLTTFNNPPYGPATFYAEILPDQVRTYVSAASNADISASFVDTYSVHGSAGGTFPITVTLSAEGSGFSWPITATVNQLYGAVRLEVGTWNPGSYVSGDPINEQFRVTPFGPSSDALVSLATTSQSPFEIPFALSATHTMTVGVGDTFDLAHGIHSALVRGKIDMMNTATISFDLPAGVWLTSTLGGTWGAIPEPSTFALVALGLGAFASRSRMHG